MHHNIPEDIGKSAVIKYNVDYNHAGNMANMKSYYGMIIYVNNAAIICYSKHYNTVQNSSFRSEFVRLRIGTEVIEPLQ